jgi:hypothetical protein
VPVRVRSRIVRVDACSRSATSSTVRYGELTGPRRGWTIPWHDERCCKQTAARTPCVQIRLAVTSGTV